MVKDENFVLLARIDDLCRRADRGEITVSCFLTPKEKRVVLRHMASKGMIGRCLMYGGYAEAERCRAYILPDYISDADDFADIEPYMEKKDIVALRILGSGYRRLTHRDYLGSILGLGIEREVLGDIVFEDSDDESAILFCDAVIADFLLCELKKIANDTVKVKKAEISRNFVPKREFAHISDTVASARIDSVVAALCSLSREKAAAAVNSGIVEVDYEVETRQERFVAPPCIVSVRGYGKFRVNSVSEQTRRGRFRLSADRYI